MKRTTIDVNSDFKCIHCGGFVTAQAAVAGVQNRNHCPYCLWSRHVDLRQAGDRLAACKAAMEPVGLTLKRVKKKYVRENQGELMLVHRCTGCEKLSINRIAADDLETVLMEVFGRAQGLPVELLDRIKASGIEMLQESDRAVVVRQLFGAR